MSSMAAPGHLTAGAGRAGDLATLAGPWTWPIQHFSWELPPAQAKDADMWVLIRNSINSTHHHHAARVVELDGGASRRALGSPANRL